jgi:hypothetical protein
LRAVTVEAERAAILRV